MSNHDPYSDSPSLLVGFSTTKVYSGVRSRHCHGINSAQNSSRRECVSCRSVRLIALHRCPGATTLAGQRANLSPARFLLFPVEVCVLDGKLLLAGRHWAESLLASIGVSEEVRLRFLRCPWCRSTRLMTPHQHGKHVCRGCGHTIMSENLAFGCTCHHCAGHLKIGKSGPQEIPAVGRPTVDARCPESSVV